MTNTLVQLDERDLRRQHQPAPQSNRRQAGASQQEPCTLHRLAQAMSHDLRRPLQSVADSCRSLLERYPDALDPKTTCLVEDALEAVANMQCLLAELLGSADGAAAKHCPTNAGN
jgi:K+-sensing histidine kinase KdpD